MGRASHRHRVSRRTQARGLGFTLVEVLVALAIMAVVATLTWRGIDGMARTREISQASLDRSLRLGAVLAQWERDLQAVQDGSGVPAIAFDGATLRLVRESDNGLQLVAWTLRDGAVFRWSSPAVTRKTELSEAWMRSQQLMGDEDGTLKVLDDVASWQVYFYRGNGWTNPQSTGDRSPAPAAAAAPPAVAASVAPGGSSPAAGAQGGAGAPAVAPADTGERVPQGVRLIVQLPAGSITRDVLMSGPG